MELSKESEKTLIDLMGKFKDIEVGDHGKLSDMDSNRIMELSHNLFSENDEKDRTGV